MRQRLVMSGGVIKAASARAADIDAELEQLRATNQKLREALGKLIRWVPLDMQNEIKSGLLHGEHYDERYAADIQSIRAALKEVE